MLPVSHPCRAIGLLPVDGSLVASEKFSLQSKGKRA
jgi:hypothetical protein